MILPDVNVLLHALRALDPDQERVRAWLVAEINSGRPFILTDAVIAGVVRIATHPRIFDPPTPLQTVIDFLDGIVSLDNCLRIGPGQRHWDIFKEVIIESDARGNLVPDAQLAAISIEHGATIATRDRGFSRFPNCRWVDPLAIAP